MKHHVRKVDSLFDFMKAEIIERSEEKLKANPQGFPFSALVAELLEDLEKEAYQICQYMAFEKGASSIEDLFVEDAE